MKIIVIAGSAHANGASTYLAARFNAGALTYPQIGRCGQQAYDFGARRISGGCSGRMPGQSTVLGQ